MCVGKIYRFADDNLHKETISVVEEAYWDDIDIVKCPVCGCVNNKNAVSPSVISRMSNILVSTYCPHCKSHTLYQCYKDK